MVSSAALVDTRRAAHLAGGDQHNLVRQSARFEVFDKSRHRVVETSANRVHAVDHAQVVAVGVHVPHAGVTGVNRHEAAARLAHSPGQQQ